MLFSRQPADNGYLGASLTLAAVFVLVATPHYPWYFLWLLPLLCLVLYWPMLLLTAASFLLYLALANRSPSMELLVNSLLYGLFLVAAVVHLALGRWRRNLPEGPAVASGAPPARSP